MTATVHVIGAGLSGLATAVDVARAGLRAIVYEAAGHAGGRCRSFHDATLDRTIDNGNHLVLSGNHAIHNYLETLGATSRLVGPDAAEFPFVDLATNERWCVRPDSGVVPWWILNPQRRIPGTRIVDYLAGLRLAFAGKEATVAACVGNGALFRRFWQPLTEAVLNTSAEEGAAHLLWPVLRETFGRGEAACRPRIARDGLSDCFVDPALAYLRRSGCEVRMHARVRALKLTSERVECLVLAGGEEQDVRAGDAVVVAIPPHLAADLVPGLTVPQAYRAIVNGHFRLSQALPGPALVGIVGGICHWLFLRGDVASITISAADAYLERSADALAEAMWQDIVRILNLRDAPRPVFRIIREKRATFLQTPAEVARRPGCETTWSNLLLAGDWTDTGLPATLEGSVRSGNTAAAKALSVVHRA